MTNPISQRLWRDVWVGCLLISAFIALGYWLDWDAKTTQYYFDSASQRFLLAETHHWWFVDVLHNGIKKAEIVFILLPLLGVFGYFAVHRRWQALNTPGYILLAIALSLGIVSLIRSQSPVACPWDLTHYGGHLPLVSPWAFFQGYHGQCWPSAHASDGFCLFALFFWLRARSSRWAWPVLVAVLALGALMSWTQIVRGAHFLSHCSWSLLFCYGVSGIIACYWWRKP